MDNAINDAPEFVEACNECDECSCPPDPKESSLYKYAEQELREAGWFDDDGMYGDMIGVAVMELIEKFCEQGHSGMSAGVTRSLFDRLANYKPLQKLKDVPEQWADNMGDGSFSMHKKCSAVFKEKNGKIYWLHGRIFKDKDGCTYTSSASRLALKLPCDLPKAKTYPSWTEPFFRWKNKIQGL